MSPLYFSANVRNQEIRHFITGREKNIKVFAPKLTKIDIRNIFLFYPEEAFAKYYTGSDIEFSILRCAEREKRKIKFYKQCH